MQVPAILAALAVTFTGTGPAPVLTPQQKAAMDRMMKECRPTSPYVAEKSGVFRDQRLQPRKLTELPPATTYMAVFRHIGACEAPLTMSDYRNPPR
ncbi:hypothetical protein [Sphingomonas segetis]|jgi:hypothetical protein|uniref:hypothetical protein n=1 Tax=Sphingomonas segetis TaxID=1104779 RepID=UPI0012D35A43|nr:hypothetical protein [Sphingomonas segetis]